MLQNKITLNIIGKNDFDALMSIFKHEKVGETSMVPPLPDIETELRLFSRLHTLSTSGEKFVMGIFLDNALIGILNEVERHDCIIELGYAIHPKYSGKGYMTNALSLGISHLFANGIKEIIAGAFDDNVASLRVMQKCGMILMDKTEEIEYRDRVHRCIYYHITND